MPRYKRDSTASHAGGTEFKYRGKRKSTIASASSAGESIQRRLDPLPDSIAGDSRQVTVAGLPRVEVNNDGSVPNP